MISAELNEIFSGLFLEGLFYGLYSGMFAMYFQIQASKKDSSKVQNIIFYALCTLYVLSLAVFVCDIILPIYEFHGKSMDSLLHISYVQMTSFCFCDFIAQFILIYRCWIVWNRNIRVVIIPSILAFAFLATWLSYNGSVYISSDRFSTPPWGFRTILTSLVLSLTVNALVTGLIVFRIFKVFQEVKTASDGQVLGATGRNRLRRTILVLIESGMALFSIQLARLVVTIVQTPDTAYVDFTIICKIHQMLNGIIPTIILVRTSLGLSFHDEKSMEQVAIGRLRPPPDHPNPIPEMGSIGIVDQDGREDGGIHIQRRIDIEVVER